MEEVKTRVHFGSLEEQERARLDAGEGDGDGLSAAVQAGIQAGNINITRGEHYLEHVSVQRLQEVVRRASDGALLQMPL